MRTEILTPTEENLTRAAEVILRGELAAFPTETVYGVGADGFNVAACREIFAVKDRPADKPLSLHVANLEQVERVAKISSAAEKLFEKFCPGPLTLILPKTDLVPDFVTCGLEGVGIRFVDNLAARKLIEIVGKPLAASSANISGREPPSTAQEVMENLGGKIPLIVDGGACKLGISSTVVDLTSDTPKILRLGTILPEEILSTLN